MERKLQNILITGGAGFIGTNFIRYLFGNTEFKGTIVNVDKLTYAGNIENLADIERRFGGTRYYFERNDICDRKAMMAVVKKYDIDTIVHFAAESHVDRSITNPDDFIQTNVVGTLILLEAALGYWGARRDTLFHHISTDEVFGSLGISGFFYETTAYNPQSPYSASKAASDHLVRAYHNTYRLPVTISNCSNNYGPYQFPEKLIPVVILNALAGKKIPVYGEGLNIRDWLHVNDHAAAVWTILNRGNDGETYVVGGLGEKQNINLVRSLCRLFDELIPNPQIKNYASLITFVEDRPGHDLRYAIKPDKIMRELGWQPAITFESGLRETVMWYLNNRKWYERILSGEYRLERLGLREHVK